MGAHQTVAVSSSSSLPEFKEPRGLDDLVNSYRSVFYAILSPSTSPERDPVGSDGEYANEFEDQALQYRPSRHGLFAKCLLSAMVGCKLFQNDG